MSTFSVYVGTTKETTSYLFGGSFSTGATYFQNILTTLQDNVQKLIGAKDLRDAILSVGSSYIFKETTTFGLSQSYIAVDTLDYSTQSSVVSLRDLQGYKMLFGKRAFSGTFSYDLGHDIFNIASTYSLLNSDIDMFFYNTKLDDVSQNTTRLSIVAGSTSNATTQVATPYIQSQIVETGLIDSLSLDFVNPSGDVVVRSDFGTISIANPIGGTYSIDFPNISNSSGSASTNKTLKWGPNGLYWDEIRYPILSHYGITGSELNIFGSEVYLNGYSLEFTDSRKVPININDVNFGETFDHYSLADLIRRLIYPYLGPKVSIKLNSPYEFGYVEVGTYPTPTLSYKIEKRSLDTQQAVLTNQIPGFVTPISSNNYLSVTGSSNGIVFSPIDDSSTQFSISVSDGLSTSTASTEITGIYPYFSGFSTLNNMSNVGLGTLTKIIEPKTDKTINILGTGSFFFIYDYDYGTLSNIFDGAGNTCSASFSYTDLVMSSPTGLWAGKRFYIYKWAGATQTPPSQNYEFKY
jgi:hypothetical protein